MHIHVQMHIQRIQFYRIIGGTYLLPRYLPKAFPNYQEVGSMIT